MDAAKSRAARALESAVEKARVEAIAHTTEAMRQQVLDAVNEVETRLREQNHLIATAAREKAVAETEKNTIQATTESLFTQFESQLQDARKLRESQEQAAAMREKMLDAIVKK